MSPPHGTPARAAGGCHCQDCIEAGINPVKDVLLDLLCVVYGPVYAAGCLLRLVGRLLAPPRRVYRPWRRWRRGLDGRLHRLEPTTWKARP